MREYQSHKIYLVGKVALSDGKEIVTLIDQYQDPGTLITADDARRLIEDLQTYVELLSPEEIEEYNISVRDSIQQDIDDFNNRIKENKHRKRTRPAKHVYLFYSKPLNKYKIGIAKDVKERVKGFIQDEAIIITHSSLRDDAWDQEQLLHKEYEKYSCGNEWFIFPTRELVEEVTKKISSL